MVSPRISLSSSSSSSSFDSFAAGRFLPRSPWSGGLVDDPGFIEGEEVPDTVRGARVCGFVTTGRDIVDDVTFGFGSNASKLDFIREFGWSEDGSGLG